MNTELTFKQEVFAREYVTDGNATRAATDAGFSEKTAYSKGCSLLKIASVKSRIDELTEEAAERTDLKMDEVIKYWQEILSNPGERTSDRTKVSELIAKYLGAFTDKVEIETTVAPSVSHVSLKERIAIMGRCREDVMGKSDDES